MADKNLKLVIDGCSKPVRISLEGRMVGQVSCEKADEILATLDKFFKKRNLRLQEIDEIAAPTFCAKGSYTGHRVGIAIVNALNFVLGRDRMLIPKYGQRPKINLRK
jgi:tRNA A37 threonylcarbamoyladenosine modification protein TsaB